MSGRIRTIKPEWLEDELLAAASDEARVLSVALILMADDYGRGRASALVRAVRFLVSSMVDERDDEREPVRPDARLVVTREAGGYLARIEGDDVDPGAIADTPEEAVEMMVKGPASRFARVAVVTDYDDEPDDDDDDDEEEDDGDGGVDRQLVLFDDDDDGDGAEQLELFGDE